MGPRPGEAAAGPPPARTGRSKRLALVIGALVALVAIAIGVASFGASDATSEMQAANNDGWRSLSPNDQYYACEVNMRDWGPERSYYYSILGPPGAPSSIQDFAESSGIPIEVLVAEFEAEYPLPDFVRNAKRNCRQVGVFLDW